LIAISRPTSAATRRQVDAFAFDLLLLLDQDVAVLQAEEKDGRKDEAEREQAERGSDAAGLLPETPRPRIGRQLLDRGENWTTTEPAPFLRTRLATTTRKLCRDRTTWARQGAIAPAPQRNMIYAAPEATSIPKKLS